MDMASSGVVTFDQIPVLPANTIDSDHYVDGSIDAVHLSANAVDSANIVSGSIDLAHMSVNSIDSDQYVDGSIDSIHIADNAIDAQRLNVSGNGTSGYAVVSDGDGSFSYAAFSGSNTTYSQSAVASGDNVNLRLTPSAGGDDDILVTAGTGITVSSVGVGGFTINAAGGTAAAVTVADESSDAACFPLFATAATGDLAPKSGTNLTFNSSSGLLTATALAGTGANITSLSGSNISSGTVAAARVATLNQNTTGSAATLTTGRTIGMTGDVVWTSASFNGSGNVTAAATIQTDAVDIAMLSATGTAGNTTFLRGDNSWVVPTDTNTQLSDEQVQDIVGAMFSSNTETRITATYQDGDGTIDLVVDDLDTDTNTWRGVTAGGNTLASNETLAFTAGTGITITESGGAVTLTNSIADTNLTTEEVQDIVGAMFTSNTETRGSLTYQDGDGTIDLVVDNMTANDNTWRGVTAGGNTLSTSETLAFTAGTNVTISESGGAVTINSTDQYTGTSNLALGESSTTAYRGDRGKIGYDHSQAAHAPSNATTNTGTVTGTGTDDYYARWTSGSALEGRTAAQVLSDIGAAASSHGDHLSLGTGSGNAYRADRALIAYDHSQATHAPTDANNYSHPTSAGNKHVPTGGSANQFLKYSASGTAVWATPSYTTNTDTIYTAGAGIGLSTLDLNVAVNASGDSNLLQDANGISLRSNPTFTGTISGTAVTMSGNITSNTSDARLKDVIGTIESPLEKLSKISGYEFTWNETAKNLEGNTFDDETQVGVMAQELEEILPSVVKPSAFEGYKTVQYEKIVPLLIESIKELQKEVESLKDSKS
jgi:hypothetical protein